MNHTVKRVIVGFIAGAMVLTGAVPGGAGAIHAASPIATVTVNGSTSTYTDLGSLVNAVDDYTNKTVRIEMLADWGNKRLVIPANSNTTLNMNGHIFNRALTSSKSDGEVIWIGSKATVTINGGPADISHNVGVYNGTSTSTKNNTPRTYKGGVIAGGYSTNGAGGIDIKSEVTLILNHVTIAGCRAEQSWGTDGYGGGIWVHGGTNTAGTIRMNGSTITGCYAYNDGGGLYQTNHNNFTLEMTDSHIDSNFAEDEGGGLAIDGESISIVGDGKSTISGNGADDAGGGIYLWNDSVSVSGLIMENNRTSGNGGAVCAEEESITLSNLKVKGNSAKNGGGLYISNDSTTVAGCTVTGNKASEKGGGLYTGNNLDEGFNVSGTCVFKDNTNGNFRIRGGDRPNFTLARGSDVHVYFDSPENGKMISPGKTGDTIKSTNCIKFLTCDNSGYWFTFNNAPDQRKIYLESSGSESRGEGYEPQDPVTVSAADAGAVPVAGETVTGGRGEYDLLRGYFTYPSMESGEDDNVSVFYFSDGYFDSDPKTYSDQLATASWALNMAGGHLHAGGVEDYSKKSAAARQFLADIGCPDGSIYVNDYMLEKPGTDSMGVSIASKELKTKDGEKTGYTLIPIALRGVGYEAEWASNCKLGDGSKYDGEAQGFAEAAGIAMDEVAYYIERFDLADEISEGKVKFWISGFSRAGATANITAKRLVEKYCSKQGNQVFAYPCEAPQGGVDKAEKLSPEAYYCIHNLINYADLVPLVGPSEMGFKRYGVDHYIPGTKAGTVVPDKQEITNSSDNAGVTTVTTYRDNDYIVTKKDGSDNSSYTDLRGVMLRQMAAVDPGMVFDDYFHIGAINFIPMDIYEKGSYKWTEEEYIRDFIEFMQTARISSRKVWAEDKVAFGDTTYNTIQGAASDSMALLFGMTSDQKTGFTNRASSIMNAISYISLSESDMYNVWDDVIGDWHTLSAVKKKKYVTFFWNKLNDTGAFEFLSSDEKAKLEKNWPTLADMIFGMVDADYATDEVYDTNRTMTYFGTLAINMSRILQMHNPEVNFSWARTQDSYYDNETQAYKISTQGHEVEAPTAVIGDQTLEPGDAGLESNVFEGSRVMKLSGTNVKGAAIYYDMKDTTHGITKKGQLYRGGVDLPIGKESTDYVVTAYAISYGHQSEAVTYKVKVYNKNHTVSLVTEEDDPDHGGHTIKKTQSFVYSEGEQVTLAAEDLTYQVFAGWQVKAGDTDVTEALLNEDQRKASIVTFVMPEAEAGTTYAEGYTLTFTAHYEAKASERIALNDWGKLTDNGFEPYETFTPDGPLPTAVRVGYTAVAGSIEDLTEEVQWTYTVGEGDNAQTVLCGAGEEICPGTVYTASVRLPKRLGIVFPDELELSVSDRLQAMLEEGTESVVRNADGSLTISFRVATEGEAVSHGLAQLDVELCDKNLLDGEAFATQSYLVKAGETVKLTAPKEEGVQFSDWTDLPSSSSYADGKSEEQTISIPVGGDLAIKAWYYPLVKRVNAEIEAPVAGMEMAAKASAMRVTVTDTYEVSPDNVALSWSPKPLSGRTADYLTTYMAACAVLKSKDDEGREFIHVTDVTEGDNKGKEQDITGEFRYADDLEVYVNGQKAVCDTQNNIVYFAFPQTEERAANLQFVKNPADIFNVPYGTSGKGVTKYLPETAEIIVADHSVSEAPVRWTNISQDLDGSGETDETVWKVSGTVQLPETVTNKNDVSTEVSVKVTVDGAPYASAPKASVESGKFMTSQSISLYADEPGAKIYYTTDGSEPTRESAVFDESHPIEVSVDQLKQGFIIQAITVTDGLRVGEPAVYEYEFQDKLTVPTGNSLEYNARKQIGVEAGAAYTLKPKSGSGLSIDAEGNAVAQGVGKYTVTAHLNEGFKWRIPKTSDLTTDDQDITFEIKPVSLKGASVKAVDKVYTGKALKPAVKVTVRGFVVPASYYNVIYSQNKAVGTGSVRIAGKSGLSKDSAETTFKILPAKAVIKSVKAGKRRMTVRLTTKPSKKGGTRYQIRYRIKGKKKWKTVKIKSKKKTIKKLKRRKKYQVQARAYKKVNGVIYYGAWSKVKKSKKIR